ncbi:hypothetical protein [Delftia sp. HK171]|uniref:hypothetical protein n=1 Tax=Delftia sp. HK171 TaxID=1920191 RepID=UPI0012EB1E27|nr:hypothetical protein [Delftia sp. HK171]
MKQLQAAMAPAIGKPMRLSCIDRRRRHSPFEQAVFNNKKKNLSCKSIIQMKPQVSINALNNSIKSHVIYFINRFYDLIVKMQMLIVFHNQGGTFAANAAHSPEKAMTARRLQRRKRQPQCSANVTTAQQLL